MNWVALLFAAISALVGGGLWWWRMNVGKELALMQATATSSARDIAGMASGTLVEIKGTLKTAAPLKAEFSGRECVYYRSLTEREVERVSYSGGKRQSRREYETETDVARHAPAMLEDASGAVALSFEGAKVEGEQVHQRRESAGIGTALLAGVIGAGTLAHRYTEWIVAAGVPVYVLASVTANKTLGAPADKKNPFVISIKSEEERQKSLKRTRLWLVIGMIAAAAATAGLLYLAATPGPAGG